MNLKKCLQEVEKVGEIEGAIIFKATRKLTLSEHEQLSNKIKFESEKTGVKIILMPFSCELGGDD